MQSDRSFRITTGSGILVVAVVLMMILTNNATGGSAAYGTFIHKLFNLIVHKANVQQPLAIHVGMLRTFQSHSTSVQRVVNAWRDTFWWRDG